MWHSALNLAFCRSVMYDETVFPNPHLFQPERFLKPDGSLNEHIEVDPIDWVFGFGRRCVSDTMPKLVPDLSIGVSE